VANRSRASPAGSGAALVRAGESELEFDRQAPLGQAERVLLQSYLDEITERVAPYLDAALLQELHQLVDQTSPQHLLEQPYLSMTWLSVLALGRKPPV
jgi:hypothetical protein